MCHLGQEDFFDAAHQHVSQLKTTVGVGLSTHAPEEAGKAVRAGADYVAIGPVYPTGTKPNAKPVTLEYVRWADENVRIPWFAIGGINLNTIDEVIAAGARRVCVVSAILNSADVKAECQEFKRRLE
jgi:thiamine-phosphate pyrophosphorylase